MAALGTAGKKVDLLIRQGADFVLPFELFETLPDGTVTDEPLDLTSHVIRAQIRKTVKSSALVAAFTCVIDADPTTGKFTLRLSNATTALIPAGETRDSKESQYAWDAELVSPTNFVLPLAWGAVSIHPEVTRT